MQGQQDESTLTMLFTVKRTSLFMSAAGNEWLKEKRGLSFEKLPCSSTAA